MEGQFNLEYGYFDVNRAVNWRPIPLDGDVGSYSEYAYFQQLGEPVGRIYFALFRKYRPVTTFNFRKFLLGYRTTYHPIFDEEIWNDEDKFIHYSSTMTGSELKDVPLLRFTDTRLKIFPYIGLFGGNVIHDREGQDVDGWSVYGSKFPREEVDEEIPHDQPFLLTAPAYSGHHDSNFIFTTTPLPELDANDSAAVFGCVFDVRSQELLTKLVNVHTPASVEPRDNQITYIISDARLISDPMATELRCLHGDDPSKITSIDISKFALSLYHKYSEEYLHFKKKRKQDAEPLQSINVYGVHPDITPLISEQQKFQDSINPYAYSLYYDNKMAVRSKYPKMYRPKPWKSSLGVPGVKAWEQGGETYNDDDLSQIHDPPLYNDEALLTKIKPAVLKPIRLTMEQEAELKTMSPMEREIALDQLHRLRSDKFQIKMGGETDTPPYHKPYLAEDDDNVGLIDFQKSMNPATKQREAVQVAQFREYRDQYLDYQDQLLEASTIQPAYTTPEDQLKLAGMFDDPDQQQQYIARLRLRQRDDRLSQFEDHVQKEMIIPPEDQLNVVLDPAYELKHRPAIDPSPDTFDRVIRQRRTPQPPRKRGPNPHKIRTQLYHDRARDDNDHFWSEYIPSHVTERAEDFSNDDGTDRQNAADIHYLQTLYQPKGQWEPSEWIQTQDDLDKIRNIHLGRIRPDYTEQVKRSIIESEAKDDYEMIRPFMDPDLLTQGGPSSVEQRSNEFIGLEISKKLLEKSIDEEGVFPSKEQLKRPRNDPSAVFPYSNKPPRNGHQAPPPPPPPPRRGRNADVRNPRRESGMFPPRRQQKHHQQQPQQPPRPRSPQDGRGGHDGRHNHNRGKPRHDNRGGQGGPPRHGGRGPPRQGGKQRRRSPQRGDYEHEGGEESGYRH